MNYKLGYIQFFLLFGWMLVSFILMFLINDSDLSIMVLGQFLFIISLLLYIVTKDNSKILIFPYLILLALFTISPLISSLLDTVNLSLSQFHGILFLLGTLIAGIALIICPIKQYKHLVNVCTYEITATLVRYDKECYDELIIYPVFGFRYNNKDYETSNKYLYFDFNKEVGSTENLKINPNNPEEFIIEKPKKYLSIPICGIILIIFSIYIYMVFVKAS